MTFPCLTKSRMGVASGKDRNTTDSGGGGKSSRGNRIRLHPQERFRRLIPYMSFYYTNGYNSNHAYPELNLGLSTVPNKLDSQHNQQHSHYDPYLMPVLVAPAPPPQRIPVLVQDPLTRVITQNYVNIAKQSSRVHGPYPSTSYSTGQSNPKPRPYYTKTTEPTVTITQSQEINVTPLPPTGYSDDMHSYYSKQAPAYRPENTRMYEPQPAPIAYQQPQPLYDQQLQQDPIDPDYNSILDGYQISKALPERITTENLGSSIETLSKILRILQKAHALPQSAKQLMKTFPKPEYVPRPTYVKKKVVHKVVHPDDEEGGTPGRAGIDYPTYSEIPHTTFNCKDQRYKGFFGDPETSCQVWHYCDLNGGQASFLCPNGTIFSQAALTCDWWFNVKCSSTAQLYVLNERLYKYILPQKPSFPEDYSGPLVDRYLALKYQEIQDKNSNSTESPPQDDLDDIDESQNEARRSIAATYVQGQR